MDGQNISHELPFRDTTGAAARAPPRVNDGSRTRFRWFTISPRYRTSTFTIVRVAGIEPALHVPKTRVQPMTLHPGALCWNRTNASGFSNQRFHQVSLEGDSTTS